jgi:opacity protein-like surface antigen
MEVWLMRFRVSALLTMALFLSAVAMAEDSPKVQIFGGYSLLHADTAGVSNSSVDALLGTSGSSATSNFSGWNTELQYNVKPWLGAVADFSGNYGTAISPASGSALSGTPSFSSHSFLFGPVLQQSRGKVRPFVHALFGVNRLSSDATAAATFFGVAPATTADTAFAMALGGGLDYKLTKRFAVRLGQLDYLYTRHNPLAYAGAFYGTTALSGTANHQNNLRFSAGLTFAF